jgi:hypothetical protein
MGPRARWLAYALVVASCAPEGVPESAVHLDSHSLALEDAPPAPPAPVPGQGGLALQWKRKLADYEVRSQVITAKRRVLAVGPHGQVYLTAHPDASTHGSLVTLDGMSGELVEERALPELSNAASVTVAPDGSTFVLGGSSAQADITSLLRYDPTGQCTGECRYVPSNGTLRMGWGAGAKYVPAVRAQYLFGGNTIVRCGSGGWTEHLPPQVIDYEIADNGDALYARTAQLYMPPPNDSWLEEGFILHRRAGDNRAAGGFPHGYLFGTTQGRSRETQLADLAVMPDGSAIYAVGHTEGSGPRCINLVPRLPECCGASNAPSCPVDYVCRPEVCLDPPRRCDAGDCSGSFVAKISPTDGAVQWQQVDTTLEFGEAKLVAAAADGGAWVVGRGDAPTLGGPGVVELRRYAADGALRGYKRFTPKTPAHTVDLVALVPNALGGVYVVGEVSFVDPSLGLWERHYDRDLFIVSIGGDLEVHGQQTYGKAGAPDFVLDVVVASSGEAESLYIAGRTGNVEPGVFVLKYGADQDGDGLLDVWEEKQGIDVDGDGRIDLALPGTDPRHKNIVLWYTVMDAMGPVYAASVLDAISDVAQVLEDAPVDNPDGRPGITLLHASAPELLPFEETWAVPDFEFEQMKRERLDAFFGGCPARPARCLAREAAHKVVRFAAFINSIEELVTQGPRAGLRHPSGRAEILGNDLIVALGDDLNRSNGGPAWVVDTIAGTFMHELGHTLGLRHGGADNENHKPNYHSVMNYTWTRPLCWRAPGINSGECRVGQRNHWQLNFSSGTGRHVDENRVETLLDGFTHDESHRAHWVPIGPSDVMGRYLVPEMGSRSDHPLYAQVALLAGARRLPTGHFRRDLNDVADNLHDQDAYDDHDDWHNLSFAMDGDDWAPDVVNLDAYSEPSSEDFEALGQLRCADPYRGSAEYAEVCPCEPGETRACGGVAACVEGTQVCGAGGVFGACEDAIYPQPGQSCEPALPTGSIALTPGAQSELFGGNVTYGSANARHDLACPSGQAIVGFHGRRGWSFDALGVSCARPTVAASSEPNTVFDIVTGPASVMPEAGASSGTAFDARCPDGQFVVGTGLWTHASDTGASIYGLSFVCSSHRVAQTADGYSVERSGVPWSSERFADPAGNVPAERRDFTCPDAQLMSRARLYVGAWPRGANITTVNGIALGCSVASFQEGDVEPPATDERVLPLTPGATSSLFGGTKTHGVDNQHTASRCPAGQVVTGLHGQRGWSFDTLGVTCALPVLAPSGEAHPAYGLFPRGEQRMVAAGGSSSAASFDARCPDGTAVTGGTVWTATVSQGAGIFGLQFTCSAYGASLLTEAPQRRGEPHQSERLAQPDGSIPAQPSAFTCTGEAMVTGLDLYFGAWPVSASIHTINGLRFECASAQAAQSLR